ncbi:hypothetical protein EV360DRAFT_50905, partial [Lentinula raphanica]
MSRQEPLQLGDKVIPVKNVMKLLGLLFDRELRFKEQSAAAVAKGQAWISQFRRLSRTTGGAAASHVREWYIATLMSGMLYGADVFLTPQHHPGAASRDGSVRKKPQRAVVGKLASIQRQVALMITGALPSTPTDLLDIHADLLPMPLAIDK